MRRLLVIYFIFLVLSNDGMCQNKLTRGTFTINRYDTLDANMDEYYGDDITVDQALMADGLAITGCKVTGFNLTIKIRNNGKFECDTIKAPAGMASASDKLTSEMQQAIKLYNEIPRDCYTAYLVFYNISFMGPTGITGHVKDRRYILTGYQ